MECRKRHFNYTQLYILIPPTFTMFLGISIYLNKYFPKLTILYPLFHFIIITNILVLVICILLKPTKLTTVFYAVSIFVSLPLTTAWVNFSKTNDRFDVVVMTYNVSRYYDANKKTDRNINNSSLQKILDLVAEHRVDVLLLQEDNVDHNIIELISKTSGLEHKCLSNDNSISTLSKYELENCKFNNFNNKVNGYSSMTISVKGNDIKIINYHLTSNTSQSMLLDNNNFGKLSKLYSSISRYLKAHDLRLHEVEQINKSITSAEFVIAAGDLNDVPYSAVYNTFTEKLRDTYRDSGVGMGFTFYYLLIPLRLDYIFHSRNMFSNYTRVIREGYSDHYPVISRLRFSTG